VDIGIKGKFALITGGSHGIGRAAALALAEEGCNIAICARDKQRVEETVKAIESFGVKSLGISADVLKDEDIKNTMETLIRSWGTIHILINNV
jgi:3-oxoacyl-[acyl-carrier protein] reductase